MPGTKALVLESPCSLIEHELDMPECQIGDAIIEIEACGLCGTDHEQYSGVLPSPGPFIPGHESIGIVVASGDGTKETLGIEIGDRVALEVFQSCRTCQECINGNYRYCLNHGIGDMYGFIPLSKSPGLWGGYASHQYLSPSSILHKIPSGLEPRVATLFNPLGAGIRWGATLPETKPGDVVAILGPGIRGLCALVGALEAGASFVMVTGLGAKDSSRLEAARLFGANLIVDVGEENPSKALYQATGKQADVVIDVTAKAPKAFAQAIEVAKPGGTVVFAGTRGSSEVPGFWPDLIVYKELRILGALGVDSESYKTAISILHSGKYPFEHIERQAAGFSGVSRLIETMGGQGLDHPPIHGVFDPSI